MQMRYTSTELLIGNTTVNVFVYHSLLPLQMVSEWEVLKRGSFWQIWLLGSMARELVESLLPLVLRRHCELSLKANLKFTRGSIVFN